jgi:hypothetical protein
MILWPSSKDRDPAIGFFGIEQIEHGTRDSPWAPFGGLEMHAEAWSCIDFYDSAAGLADGLGNVGANEIDAGDVEADDLGSASGDQGILGMDVIGAVDCGAPGRKVGSGAQEHLLSPCGYAERGQSGAPEEVFDAGIDLDAAQHLAVTITPAGILVGLFHQYDNGALAVTNDMRRHAFGDRGNLASDDQDAVIRA